MSSTDGAGRTNSLNRIEMWVISLSSTAIVFKYPVYG